jgi:hypothetical protein
MAGVVVLIWGGGKTDYFCTQGWTGQISLISHDNSGFRRTMEPLLTTVCAKAGKISARKHSKMHPANV